MEDTAVNKKITIEDIAKELGCSKTTVSRAISGKGRIGADTRERIIDFCERYGYKPNVIAKSLAESKTMNIGVILPDDSDLNEIPFFQVCLLGIIDMATSRGYDSIVTTAGIGDITKLQSLVENRKVDGVILTRSVEKDAQIAYLKQTNVPFVVVGSSESNDITQIDNHHVEGCRELTSLLIMQKMKRLAFVGSNQNHIVSQLRYKGFKEGCALHQMIPNPDLVYLNCNTRLMVDKVVSDILEKRVDCIICMDDKICGQALMRLGADHVKIPRDIKIASFYDSMFLSNYNPPVTALSFDEKGLGNAACKLLLDKISGQEVPKKTLLGYEIVLKGSTKQKQ